MLFSTLFLLINYIYNIYLCIYNILYTFIHQFCFEEFLGMIIFNFVQNVVFRVIPHFHDFRGNSTAQKILVLILHLPD